jgi:phosphoglycerate dehydrogenase-like enzyme
MPPEIADQAIGYLLVLTRSLAHFIRAQPGQEWQSRKPGLVLEELMGKTLLVIGLGGVGSEIARRAHASGMHVLTTAPLRSRPRAIEVDSPFGLLVPHPCRSNL